MLDLAAELHRSVHRGVVLGVDGAGRGRALGDLLGVAGGRDGDVALLVGERHRQVDVVPAVARAQVDAALVLILLVVAAVDRDRERHALVRRDPEVPRLDVDGRALVGAAAGGELERLAADVARGAGRREDARHQRRVDRRGVQVDAVQAVRRGSGVAVGGLVEREPGIRCGDDVGAARAVLERARRGAAVRHDDLVDGARHQRGAHLARRPVGMGGEQQGGVAGDLRRGHRGAGDGLVELACRAGLEHLRRRRVAGQDLDARRDEIGLDPVARRPEGRERGPRAARGPGCPA